MTVTISGFDCELADGVRETTQTTGTGTYQLDGPATIEGTTYRSFVAGVGNGVRVPYVSWFGNEFEVGLGTVSSGAPATISRDTILVSSNSNNAVSWGPGVKDIWLDAPAALLAQIWEQPDLPLLRTAIATTSGSTHDFEDISADAVRLTASFRHVSTNGTAGFSLRLGTSSGFLTTGYGGSITRATGGSIVQSAFSDRFLLTGTSVASDEYSGHAVLTKISGNIWVLSGIVSAEDTASTSHFSGNINLAATLTQIRLISADTFDDGLFGLYEE